MAHKYDEREINIVKVITVFSIATLLFVAGLLFGQYINNQKYEKIKTLDETISIDLTDLGMQSSLAENYPCNNYFIYSLGERIDDLGNKISLLEGQIGKTDSRVIYLKKPYTLLQVQHYLLIKKRTERCQEDYTIAMLFYSNKQEYVSDSEKQGYVLRYLADKYGYEKVKLYSIDVDVDLGIVGALKSLYNVTDYPTTVINGKIYVGFHPKEEVEPEFK
jgi:hypothetical protein